MKAWENGNVDSLKEETYKVKIANKKKKLKSRLSTTIARPPSKLNIFLNILRITWRKNTA